MTPCVRRAPPEPDLRAMFDFYDRYGLAGNAGTLARLLGREPAPFQRAIARRVPR